MFFMRGERPPEQDLATSLYKALVNHTIDDISYEQMNKITRRISQISRSDRNSAVRVGQVLADELGEQKALEYVEKALANGMIEQAEYFKVRSAIVLRLPRTEVPPPWAGAAAQQLLAGQKKLQEDIGKIRDLGLDTVRKPAEALNKDIERLRRAWGL